MNFYQQLSVYYDEIFAVRPEELRFPAAQVAGRERLLDIGCGTGNKTVHFSSVASSIVAIDLDAGMIAKAGQNHARANIRYEVMDMLDIGRHFPAASFGGILCLGNTLVHLDSPASIQGLLDKTHRLLAPQGRLVLQILNYDRILDGNVEHLPDLDTEHVVFKRRYARQGGLLRFITTLEVKGGGQPLTSDIPLYPLRKDELAASLERAGYSGLEFYGGFQGEPHTADSFITLVVGAK